ncbi:MAG: retroviral-like aspartic protease family protein [Acidobacteria bacterium]|nr:retroviral-like aspartic protease family protein [Acidobacteriota bacterium]
MVISGEWMICADGVNRPLIRGELQTGNGQWESVAFLVDTGADRTVLSAPVLAQLELSVTDAPEQLGGLGGLTEMVTVATLLRLTKQDAGKVNFRSQYAAVTEVEALDICVLGRDILGLFAVIVDEPQQVISLLSQRHSYTIVES